MLNKGTVLVNIRREKKKKRTFYINKPRSIQREIFTKEQKIRQLLFQKKKKKSTGIKNLEAKPQQEDSLFALAEEEEPRKWTSWQDPWLYQAEEWHRE